MIPITIMDIMVTDPPGDIEHMERLILPQEEIMAVITTEAIPAITRTPTTTKITRGLLNNTRKTGMMPGTRY